MFNAPIKRIVLNGDDGFQIQRADGAMVSKVDPLTRQATGAPQSFRAVTGVPVAAALMPPPLQVRPRTVADLSSAERSKLLDALVAEVNDIAAKHNAMVKGVSADIKEHRAILDAHAGVVNRRTLWGRLRWIVTGV